MSKFCGKCGSTLNENGLCPNCDSDRIETENANQSKAAQEQRNVDNSVQDNTYPKEPTKKEKKIKSKADKAAAKVKKKADEKIGKLMAKADKKSGQKSDKSAAKIKSKADKKTEKITAKFDKKANKKAAKVAKKASRPIGKKISIFLLKLLAVILAIVILFSAVSGVLVYFNIADVPVVSDIMEGLGIKSDDENEQFKSLDGRFTDISITDESSAIEAANDAAKQMGLNNAADELTSLNTSTVDGSTYYRLQENYKGIPVYGRTMVVIADENGNAQGVTSNATDIPDNLSLTPTVTQEQVNDSIKKYIDSEVYGDDATGLSVENLEIDKLAIYNLDDVKQYILCYSLSTETHNGIYNVIVNAENSNIILFNTAILNEQKEFSLEGQKKIQTFYAQNDNGVNEMKYYTDTGTIISVFNPKTDHKYDWYRNNGNIVQWKDNEKADKSAVDAMSNIQKVYSYYLNTFGRDSFNGKGLDINIFVNTEGYRDSDFNDLEFTNNAFYWLSPNGSVMNFTKCYDSNDNEIDSYSSEIDVVGHEFTHGVVAYTSELSDTNNNKMPSAINEAVADIMGYCVEARHNSDVIDWTSSVRTSIRENNKNSSSVYYYKDYNKNDDCHDSSTIVSYAAYLMNTGVNQQYNNMDISTIENLWYRTIIMLPSNSTFSIVRSYVEKTAEIIHCTDEQKECIKAAFDKVGIKSLSEDKTETYLSDSEVSVFDKNGTAYDNYTIKISGNKSTGWFSSEDYSDEIKVSNSNPKRLDLPKGTYTITVCDNFDTGKTRSIKAKIKENSDNKEIKFSTDFGADYTVRSGVNINVYDVNKAKYDDYTIKIDGTADDKSPYNDTQKITNYYGYQLNAQNGQYTVTLADNKDSSKTKSFTVRVKNSASASDINIETDFGKKFGQFDKSKLPSGAVEFNGHYYYIYTAIRGDTYWEKAKEGCESTDGYLATITSEDENKFVFSLLNKFGYKNAYFGLRDEGSNDWAWDNGEAFVYSNWASGEPSSSFEDYGMYYYKYTEQWNDGDFSLPDEEGKVGYICEWGEYSVESDQIPVTTPTRATSSERDIVLVLDTSSSMDGTPLDETKKAATNFVDTILEEDASIGVVNYDNEADMASDFANSKNALDSVINALGTGGDTDIEAGMRMADDMLSQSSAKKKFIVLMSDGEPNDGLVGDELIAYAEELKNKGIYIYTLGFFESLGDKTSAQSLMESIASDGCHYEVSDADNLIFFFGDIADQINGQKYIYVRIACPVDVSVTHNGETLDSSDKDLSTRTSFGTLSFEESDSWLDDNSYGQQNDSGEANIWFDENFDDQDSDSEESDDRVKILRLKEGEDYDIAIEGTGRGKMNYSIGFMDENGEYTDFRKFNNIKITKSTKVDTVANVSDKTVLNVDEDGDGRYDLVYKAEANGNGELVDYTYVIYIVIGVVSAIAVLVLVLVIRAKLKKRKLSKTK